TDIKDECRNAPCIESCLIAGSAIAAVQLNRKTRFIPDLAAGAPPGRRGAITADHQTPGGGMDRVESVQVEHIVQTLRIDRQMRGHERRSCRPLFSSGKSNEQIVV